MLKKTNELSKSEIELEFLVEAKDFNLFFDRALEELSKELEIKGFRKGSVPKEIALENIKKEAILSRAAEKAAQKEYDQYLSENKIEPISAPELTVLKLAENNDFDFKVKVTLLPVLDLPDYKSIAGKIKKNPVEVKEEEIKQTLDWLKKTRAKKSLKEGAAEKGDLVEIEYSSDKTGDQKDVFVLGEGKMVPGFEESIIGMKAGEKKEQAKINIPLNYKIKEIAGQEIIFTIKLISVSKIEMPEITDEFAKGVGNFSNVQELEKNIRKGIEQEKEQAEKDRRRGQILETIAEKTEGDIPSVLIERENENLTANFKEQIKSKTGLSFEDYLTKAKKTEEEMLKSLSEEAKKRVKQFLILKQIAEKEKIGASEEEIKEESDKILKRYQSTQEAEKDIDAKQLKAYTEEVVKNEKVFKLLESI